MRCGCQLFMYKQPHLVDHKCDPAGSRPFAGLGCTFQSFLFRFFFVLSINISFFLRCGSLGVHGAEIPQTHTGQTQPLFCKGKWNDSVVKWPFSTSLRTISTSPSNLHILQPCLPYTQVITRLLCLHTQYDVWVCSSPLLALRSHSGPAWGFFLPLLPAPASDTVFARLPWVSSAGGNKNTPTQTWGQLTENISRFQHQRARINSAPLVPVFLTPSLHN